MAITRYVHVGPAILECDDVCDVVEAPVFVPCSGVGDGSIVVRPVMCLASVVARDSAGPDVRPGFRRIVDQDGVVGNRAQVVIDVVRRAEFVVVSAVAGEFFVFVDQEVADVQMLVRGKTVATLEEEIRRVLVPRTPCVHVAGTGTDMRKAEPTQVRTFDRRVAPEEILVGVVSHAGPRSRLVESVDGLVARVVAEMVDENSPS